MPELPEVELIRLQLQKFLVGHVVERVEVRTASILQGDAKKLEGGEIKDVRRFGKVVVCDLSNGYSFMIHVKLTGQLIYRGLRLKSPSLSKKIVGGLGGRHTHVIFYLSEGGKLFYNDVRRFGWIKVVKTSEVEEDEFVKKLGPEPLKDLSYGKFTEIMRKSRRNVKTLLMDQARIGGIGNIYANDALWLSGIDPRRAATSLSDEELKKLFEAVESVLREGLRHGGASELAFVRPDGTEGNYQSHSLVYGKEGQVCGRCGKERIKKIVLGGRGTYICKKCQV